MQLRADFVDTVCRIYLEKSKPQIFKATETGKYCEACGVSNQGFYEFINKQEGFLALQAYFVKATLLLEREDPADGMPP